MRGSVGSGVSVQSSVEAALLLPAVLLVVGMLVQPVCVAYTRVVMHSAAAEAVRLMTTSQDLDACRNYVLRRLDAVPPAALFHVGGREDWQIDLTPPGEGSAAEATIRGRVRPLPIGGAFVRAMGTGDGADVEMAVRVTAELRPAWLEGDYGEWVCMWG